MSALITLGGYTFARNPMSISPVIAKQKFTSAVMTYDDVAVFDFGARLDGLEVSFEWDYLNEPQYAQLQTLLETAGDLVLSLDSASSNALQYNVHLMSLSGAYALYITGGAGRVRRDVSLRFIIMSEVA